MSAVSFADNDRFFELIDEMVAGSTDFNRLRLRHHGDPMAMEAILQAELRHRHRRKFASTFAANPRFLFPNALAAEQASGDEAARYHASMLGCGASDGQALAAADLTAGLGIDAMALSAAGWRVTAFDLKPENATALALNSGGRVDARCGDSIAALAGDSTAFYDTVFVDPARRDGAGRRVFALSDCAPDVVACRELIMSRCRRMVVKMSPMADLKAVAAQLPGVEEFHIIGTPTECKEVVAVVGTERGDGFVTVRCVAATLRPGCDPEILSVGNLFHCGDGEEARRVPRMACDVPGPGMAICEPWPAVMKMQCPEAVTEKWNLEMLAPSTHLFMAESPGHAEGFGGRVYEIERVEPFDSRTIKKLARERLSANVATRNFPLSAPELVRRLKIKEGGYLRLYGATAAGGRPVLIFCR